MYNFNLIADSSENIAHNQKYDLVRMNLCFEVCTFADVALKKIM
jgi:hypothetical protein